MEADHLVAGAWALAPPTVLLTALNLPTVFYANSLTRASTLVAIGATAASVILNLKIDNPSVAFMTGLLECWTTIWAAVLLLRFNPPADFSRLRWSKAPTKPSEYEADGKVWQRFPETMSIERLLWTSDLLIGFRRVGWVVEKAGTGSDKKKEQQPKTRKPKPPVGVFSAVLKVLLDYLAIQGVNWSSPRLEQQIESPQLLQALHVATWIIASVPFINFCHSCWMVVGEIGQWLSPSEAYQSWDYNPSPWGPMGAVIEYGLAGMLNLAPLKRYQLNIAGLWGVTWHGYFKFGFQSASDLVFPRSTNPKLKPLLRLGRVFWSFLLSGLIHLCGSLMLPGETQPTNELLFFLLQGVAVSIQVAFFDRLVSQRYRRILNPILVCVWLYYTGPLISEDQRAGGMWDGPGPETKVLES